MYQSSIKIWWNQPIFIQYQSPKWHPLATKLHTTFWSLDVIYSHHVLVAKEVHDGESTDFSLLSPPKSNTLVTTF